MGGEACAYDKVGVRMKKWEACVGEKTQMRHTGETRQQSEGDTQAAAGGSGSGGGLGEMVDTFAGNWVNRYLNRNEGPTCTAYIHAMYEGLLITKAATHHLKSSGTAHRASAAERMAGEIGKCAHGSSRVRSSWEVPRA